MGLFSKLLGKGEAKPDAPVGRKPTGWGIPPAEDAAAGADPAAGGAEAGAEAPPKAPVDPATQGPPAVDALAGEMTPQQGSSWAAKSAKEVSGALAPGEGETLELVEAWAKKPSPALAKTLKTKAAATDPTSPTAWAARSAEWGQPVVEAAAPGAGAAVAAGAGAAAAGGGEALAAQAVAGAVKLAAAIASGAHAPAMGGPDQAGDATGSTAMLQSIFGGGTAPKAPVPAPVDPVEAAAAAATANADPATAEALAPFLEMGRAIQAAGPPA